MSTPEPDKTAKRVLVVDDHPLFRKGVVDLLSLEQSLQLVGEASSGDQGIKLAEELRPDIVLLDLNMRGIDGLETLNQLRALGMENTKIVVLTVSNAEEDVIRAFQSGADGYLLKDMEPEAILQHLRTVVDDGVAISPELAGVLIRMVREDKPPSEPIRSKLTPRERQILEMIAAGQSNKLIARELNLAVGTVKVHVKNLLKKLGLKNRIEAAIWASKQY